MNPVRRRYILNNENLTFFFTMKRWFSSIVVFANHYYSQVCRVKLRSLSDCITPPSY